MHEMSNPVSGFHANCLQWMETICMKCQILFSGKTKKNIANMSSAKLAQRLVKVKAPVATVADDIYFFFFFSRKIRFDFVLCIGYCLVLNFEP